MPPPRQKLQKRVKLELRTDNKTPASPEFARQQSVQSEAAEACTPSKFAALTKVVETQLGIIDRLMSQLEAGGSTAELPAREMELHEKDQLYRKLCALDPEHLATACSFAWLTDARPGDEGDYTLDLSKQNRRTLWRLWNYAHKNAQTPAQKRAAAKRSLQLQELALRTTARAADGSDDSSDDDLSDLD